MGNWHVIEPLESINLVTNPSLETNTNGWTAVGGAIARSTAQQRRGLWSLEVTPRADWWDGVYFGDVAMTNGLAYTFSVDVRGALGVPYRIIIASAVEHKAFTALIGTGQWQRVEVAWICDSTTGYRLCVLKTESNSQEPFYVDGAQCEALAYATTYFDGSLDPKIGFLNSGVYWNGIYHASTSVRRGTSRMGGIVRDLEGYKFRVAEIQGAGASAIRNIITPYVQLPGGIHEVVRVEPRTMSLIGNFACDSALDLYQQRASIYNLIKPDSDNEEPFLLWHTGTGKTLELACQYDGGLEMAAVLPRIERAFIRMVAAYPFWREVET